MAVIPIAKRKIEGEWSLPARGGDSRDIVGGLIPGSKRGRASSNS